MTASLIDLSEPRRDSGDDPAALQAYLVPLVGEPFRFARVSYGDELTLHFGSLRPARSPKLAGMQYGEYALGLRASSWILKSGTVPVVLWDGVASNRGRSSIASPICNDELEKHPIVSPESRVLTASPITIEEVGRSSKRRFGLALHFSDGSWLEVLPDSSEPDRPGDERLPEVADWELLSPYGLLRVGPGSCWEFEPAPQAA